MDDLRDAIFDEAEKRMNTILKHAEGLLCRRCGSDQNQIMNAAGNNPELQWRCRKCFYRFITTIK